MRSRGSSGSRGKGWWWLCYVTSCQSAVSLNVSRCSMFRNLSALLVVYLMWCRTFPRRRLVGIFKYMRCNFVQGSLLLWMF